MYTRVPGIAFCSPSFSVIKSIQNGCESVISHSVEPDRSKDVTRHVKQKKPFATCQGCRAGCCPLKPSDLGSVKARRDIVAVCQKRVKVLSPDSFGSKVKGPSPPLFLTSGAHYPYSPPAARLRILCTPSTACLFFPARRLRSSGAAMPPFRSTEG